MAWVTVKRIENGDYGDCKLAYFDFYHKEQFAVITRKVLSYLKTDSVNELDNIFVVKTFNRNGKPIYLIKKIKKREGDE